MEAGPCTEPKGGNDNMRSSKFFNKNVVASDAYHIGHVVRETDDKIVVFGEGDERYDILKSEVQAVNRNVLIGLPFYEVVKRYKKSRKEPLPTSKPVAKWVYTHDVDLATYEKKYPKSLFNKGVRSRDEEHVGHVMMETDGEIVIFGHYNYRFDVPKSKILAVGRNVILDMGYPVVFKYLVDRNDPLPTGEPFTKLADEN
jgi:sporulation protein YlmC with PRC-barrel domain